MLEGWGRGEKEKRGKTPQFCESQLLIDPLPASRMKDTYPGRSHCLMFPESFPMAPIRSNADVIWEETRLVFLGTGEANCCAEVAEGHLCP